MDASTQLSPNYTVGDLIRTSTGIPNLPTDDYLPNLRALANVLELLSQIDTFTINSGFRSPAVNAAVGGEPNSYHSEGLAADILPDNISNQEFFYRIHNNPRFRNAVGEYILYPLSHGTIHVSAPTPNKVGFAIVQEADGSYRHHDDIPYDDRYVLPESSGDYSLPSLPASAPIYLGLALGLALVLFAVYKSRTMRDA